MRVAWIRKRLETAIASGLALGGCSDRAIEGGQGESTSGDGTSTSGSTSASTTSTSTSTTGPIDTGEAEVESGAPPVFDVGNPFDVPPDGVLDCDQIPELPERGCVGTNAGGGRSLVVTCVDPGELTECPPADAAWTREQTATCECDPGVSLREPVCGPLVDDLGSCCYWFYDEICVVPGRPFVVDGESRLAETKPGTRWIVPALSAEPDALLAAAWLHDARTEHAAIASFARFALQLLAIAAPPRFVAAASRAALDELAHARLFFTLAARHGGAPREPAALAVDGALEDSDDLVAIAVATVREGCIAETISALQLAAARDGTTDPWLRARLDETLAQELDHVDLAWSFVAWALAHGGARLHAAVREAFADAARCVPRGPDIEPTPDAFDRWRAAGRITESERMMIARTTIERIVWPIASQLLARVAPPISRGTFVQKTDNESQ